MLMAIVSETLANTSPQRLANACITAAKDGNDQLTGKEILASLKSGPWCNEWGPWELSGRICVGTFWGRMYWALNIHEETASLPHETGGEEGRGATAAEAFEIGMGPPLKFCSCIRVLWLEVAGRDGDALGVGERSNGILRLDGALPVMVDFS
jgi:hypothetical protein